MKASPSIAGHRPVGWLSVGLAVAIIGLGTSGCGSSNGQPGSSLSSAISSAGSGISGTRPSVSGTDTGTTSPPTTTSPPVTTTSPPVTVTTTSPPVTTTSPPVTTTSPPVTVTTTSPPPTTETEAAGQTTSGTEAADSGDTIPGWAYALVGALVVALIGGAVWLVRRHRSGTAPPPVAVPKSLPERQAALLAELERRVQSGWTVVSQSADSAIVERSGERTEITVDEFGALYERPLTAGDEGPPASF